MFSRKAPQVRRSQRAQVQYSLGGEATQRQQVLGLVVRNALRASGCVERPDLFSTVEDSPTGFRVDVRKSLNGEKSVSVTNEPEFTQKEAAQYAQVIIKAFGAHIGQAQAAALVRPLQRRLDIRRVGAKKADGSPLIYLDYIDVTVQVPDDATLRTLNRAFGRRR